MNIPHSIVHALASLVLAGTLVAQGPLQPPPGPRTPTMKSLQELWDDVEEVKLLNQGLWTKVDLLQQQNALLQSNIANLQGAVAEKRIPISSAPYTIGTPGSYYLTQDISVSSGNAIQFVIPEDVTLDLNGFTITSTSGTPSGSAILLQGSSTNICIKNGHIHGTTQVDNGGGKTGGGFLQGLSATSGITLVPVQVRVSDLQVSGIAGNGINFAQDGDATVERCSVRHCGGFGIIAETVTDCHVTQTARTAILSTRAVHCTGSCVGVLAGTLSATVDLAGISASVVEGCQGKAGYGAGINAATATNSRGSSSYSFGLLAGEAATNCRGFSLDGFGLFTAVAQNCTGRSSSGVGLHAVSAMNCMGTSTDGPAGLQTVGGPASYCTGDRQDGVAIQAPMAIGCAVIGTGTVNSPTKSLGTP